MKGERGIFNEVGESIIVDLFHCEFAKSAKQKRRVSRNTSEELRDKGLCVPKCHASNWCFSERVNKIKDGSHEKCEFYGN